ncbi:uncharacterized protein FTJAE_10181 [Fusarium tjaetaba]|uniref:Heterokaryon incompatibility domain-containing protein n=1 Tax=Fusarium tjaetaba TaxID=1567544 RepID=A0A8H5R0P1_9HYPO|nr:uncharacterized protein FTJAE_10181 [Fusarium tjaetaba]KAF5624732.1 hypothetical protein FTJAE_10181 [Fusarium tjaetaba]
MALTDPATTGAINSRHASSPVIQSCNFCTALEKLLADDEVEVRLEKDEICEQSCTAHVPLFHWIETNYSEHLDRLEKARKYQIVADKGYALGTIFFFRVSGRTPWLRVYSRMGNRYGSYEVLLHSKISQEEKRSDYSSSALDPDWVDLGIVKEWKERCSKEHGLKCQNPEEKDVSPAWLIDTEDDCLVSGTDNHSFVALSYRWGSSTNQKIDKDTFEQLKCPGSLSRIKKFVTATVRDAIHTVRAIGERYFWVDAICIAPDNKEELAEQLQLMGGIYASAKLTIVVLDGDSSNGIMGLKSQSSPRSLAHIFPWKDGKSVMVRQLPSLSVQSQVVSKYFQRGWTFQEYTLSQRRLIFGDQQIHWQCSCATWHEDLPGLEDPTHSLKFPNIKQGWPDFKEFNVLLNEYNNRQLTYPEDAFPAVNGLLTYLESFSFECGFLFGLPRAFFDAALMWSYNIDPTRIDVRTRRGIYRRKPSERRHSVLPNTHLPSWSWIGWQGDSIGMLDTEAQFKWSDWTLDSGSGQLASLMRPSVITTPITQWYNHASRDGSDKQHIPRYPTVYNESSEISYDTEVWSVEGPMEYGYIPREAGGKYSYKHRQNLDMVPSSRAARSAPGLEVFGRMATVTKCG